MFLKHLGWLRYPLFERWHRSVSKTYLWYYQFVYKTSTFPCRSWNNFSRTLELSDKMSNGILLTIGHDRSLYLLLLLHQGFSCGFTKILTWLSIRYDCTLFSFNGYLEMLTLAIVDEKYLIFNISKEPNFISRFLIKSYTSLIFFYIWHFTTSELPWNMLPRHSSGITDLKTPKSRLNPRAVMLDLQLSNILHWLLRRWYACFIPHLMIMVVLVKLM